MMDTTVATIRTRRFTMLALIALFAMTWHAVALGAVAAPSSAAASAPTAQDAGGPTNAMCPVVVRTRSLRMVTLQKGHSSMHARQFLPLAALAGLTGCAAHKFTWEAPASHPANPEASAAAYESPPNVLSPDWQPPAPAASSMEHDHHDRGAATNGATPEGVQPYPLDTCIVSGATLGSMGDPVVIVHEGQEMRFCCEACVPKFQAEPAKYRRALDDAVKEESGHPHH